ncbi:RING finger and WD repeat domain-containing protein 3 [Coemansia biformis]|uniref:RING finger and WD repeat domain-containing protein 3 n=1 Tax=Coemansia biformis TaxID=1286918 RepID=A0A9W7YCU0_9FUNG|nr:RING finger and WD repeat domain-containing protein 3 [Coemansia biformis]
MSGSISAELSQPSPPSLTQIFAGSLDPLPYADRQQIAEQQTRSRSDSVLSTETEAVPDAEEPDDAGAAEYVTGQEESHTGAETGSRPQKRLRADDRAESSRDDAESSRAGAPAARRDARPEVADERMSRFFSRPGDSSDAASSAAEGRQVSVAAATTASADSSRVSGDDSDSDDFARPALARPVRPPLIPGAAAGGAGSDEQGPGDDRNTCSVCLDTWTISGPHRVVSLKCGHLFGQSCAKKWLRRSSQKRIQQGLNCSKIVGKCPECNQRAEWRDIRPIYARSITAADTTKLDELRAEVKRLADAKLSLEGQRMELCLKHNQLGNEVVRLRRELESAYQKTQWLELENANLAKHIAEMGKPGLACDVPAALDDDSDVGLPDPLAAIMDDGGGQPRRTGPLAASGDEAEGGSGYAGTAGGGYFPRMRLRATIPLATQARESLRLLVVHPHEQLVYASYSRPSLHMHTLAQIDVHGSGGAAYLLDLPHRAEIRGAEVSPHALGARYMLTASLDQTAMVTYLGCGSAHGAAAALAGTKRPAPMLAVKINVGSPCWSCAWDPTDANMCYIGATSSRVFAFDMRRATIPVHTWDGPRDGACAPLPQPPRLTTGYSPIHGIVAPAPHRQNGGGAGLVVANSSHLFALPPLPERTALADAPGGQTAAAAAWTQLTRAGGSGSGRSCYSISHDATIGCVAASFRAQDAATGTAVTEHELYEADAGLDGWRQWQQQRRPLTVASAQTKMARTTVFSYRVEAPHSRRQGLFCAGVEATRSVKVWGVDGRAGRELLSLVDVAAGEDIVDVKGWQWGGDEGPQLAMFASLTNSTIRLYDVR